MGYDVVGLGMNCVDCILQLPDLPLDPEEALYETPILAWTMQGGGKVATAMAAAGRLGAKTTIVTKVGADEWGQFVVSDFQKYGVDTRHVFVDERVNTAIAFILIGKKGRNRWVSPNIIRGLPLPEVFQRAIRWVDAQPTPRNIFTWPIKYAPNELTAVTEGKILNLDGFPAEAALEAARRAYKRGIPTCYDMYSHPQLAELLQYITYCIPSRHSAMTFTREIDPIAMCKKLLKYGPEVVGITLGEEGVVFATQTELIHRKAFKIDAVDTTGAGDVFHGAFSYGLLQGWDLPRVVEFSSAVSAMKCRSLGGRAGIPTRPEVEAFLQKRVEEIR